MTASAEDPHIGVVVEGPGDSLALPILLRIWLQGRDDFRDVLGKPAICNGRERAIAKDGIERYVAAVAARPGCRAVLIVLDSEGDPACNLGPQLMARAQNATRLPVSICLAERCWEDWLHASIETLDLGSELVYQENSRGMGVIVKALQPRKYVKPTWQPRLTARMDIEKARKRSPSLARTLERFDLLLSYLPNEAVQPLEGE